MLCVLYVPGVLYARDFGAGPAVHLGGGRAALKDRTRKRAVMIFNGEARATCEDLSPIDFTLPPIDLTLRRSHSWDCDFFREKRALFAKASCFLIGFAWEVTREEVSTMTARL